VWGEAGCSVIIGKLTSLEMCFSGNVRNCGCSLQCFWADTMFIEEERNRTQTLDSCSIFFFACAGKSKTIECSDLFNIKRCRDNAADSQ
jgi:hypothetical protein